MNKHSPGPWQVMNEYDGATVVIANVDGETFSDGSSTFSYDFVCDTLPDDGDGSRSRDIAKANARLIAAAPTLAQKLQNCISALTFAIDGWDEADPYITKLRATRDGAQAALNEAQGAQS